MCFFKLVSGIGVLIAFVKAIFWLYIACAALVQIWADYLQLQNGMRIAFFVVSGSVILFFFYGFMEKKHKLSYICTLGTIGIIGGCMAGFWYVKDQQLTVLASLWGGGFFIAIYFFVKKIDYLHRYLVLLFTVCFGVILGSCHYYFSGFVGPIAIGGVMGFIMTVVYFFEDEDDQRFTQVFFCERVQKIVRYFSFTIKSFCDEDNVLSHKQILYILLFIPRFIYHKLIKTTVSFVYERLIKPIFEIKDSPHSISLGVALGLWIAFTPTIGIQMVMALIICTIFRANILIAIAMCWISNPVTMVPLYYSYYRVGLVVANERPMTQEEFHDLVHNDYNIIYDFATKNVAKEKLLEPFFIDEQREKLIYYSADNPDVASKVDAWLKQNTFTRVKVVKLSQRYASVIDKAIADKQFAVVNRNQFKKFSEEKQTSAGVVTQIKANRTGWALFLNLLALGITEIALYMWIGSLIIATLISIPAYPITYRAIVKFRETATLVSKQQSRVILRFTALFPVFRQLL